MRTFRPERKQCYSMEVIPLARLAALFVLTTACATPADPSDSTCARREECGNLEGLTVEACAAAERALLDRLSGDARATCASAIDACLDGASCDDFRACHADIDRATCPCPDPSVTIVDPIDGQTIAASEHDFVIDTVCLEDLEQVELFLLDPVESSYGFGRPDPAGRATIRVPLIPGTNRFVARGTTTPVTSAEITVTVAP